MFSRPIIAAVSLCLASFVLARPQTDAEAAPRSPTDQKYLFAHEAETYLSNPLSQDFSCEGRAYGYYADVPNNCQVFHICMPIENDAREVVETAHWSFICGNATMFDQATLTCNYPENSAPCDTAETLYNAVEFGKVEPAEDAAPAASTF